MNKFFAYIFFIPLFVDAVKLKFPDLKNVNLSASGREKCQLIADISGRIQARIQQMGRTLPRGVQSPQLVQLQKSLEEVRQSIEEENLRVSSQYQSMIQMSSEQSFVTIVNYLEKLQSIPIKTLQDSQAAQSIVERVVTLENSLLSRSTLMSQRLVDQSSALLTKSFKRGNTTTHKPKRRFGCIK